MCPRHRLTLPRRTSQLAPLQCPFLCRLHLSPPACERLRRPSAETRVSGRQRWADSDKGYLQPRCHSPPVRPAAGQQICSQRYRPLSSPRNAQTRRSVWVVSKALASVMTREDCPTHGSRRIMGWPFSAFSCQNFSPSGIIKSTSLPSTARSVGLTMFALT
jgi:hypothetical protein